MALEWNNLDKTTSYTQLRDTDTLISLSDDLTGERVESWKVPAGAGLMFHYGASMVTETDLTRLQALSDEQELIGKYKAVLSGERINTGEDRRVLHQLTRGQLGENVIEGGINLRSFYIEQNARVRDFAKFGRLYLNNGNWNGEQIVPEKWVKKSTSIINDSRDSQGYPYTYQWRVLENGAFFAKGILGQYIFVYPEKNLIFVRIGKKYGGVDWADLFLELSKQL